jgi:glycosyltransferase involved in cell wall biosynthesis
VEAALNGTPVVADDTDWHSELVKDGSTGVLAPYRDTHVMAVGVCKLLKDQEYGSGSEPLLGRTP